MRGASQDNKVTADVHEPVDMGIKLTCRPCGQAEEYAVGRLYIDPEMIASRGAGAINEAFAFTNYFHCKHCGAGGPWDLTDTARWQLLTLVLEATTAPEKARIYPLKVVLFDGTVSRWATHAEAHLKQLIAKAPDDYYLWGR